MIEKESNGKKTEEKIAIYGSKIAIYGSKKLQLTEEETETKRNGRKRITGVEIWYAADTMLKDNLKLHGSTNQACNEQDEEEKMKLKTVYYFM